MKTLSKITLISASIAFLAGIATAQPYPAYEVLDNLSTEQVTQLKQLGRLPASDSINPIYEANVDRILTPEQSAQYAQIKYGPRTPSNSNDFNFNMDSK